MAFSYSSAINSLTAGAAQHVADVVTLFNDVKAVLNNGITGPDHMSASANIADTQLASPNSPVYKRLQTVRGVASSSVPATCLFAAWAPGIVISGSNLSTTQLPELISLAAADYAVAGKTTKLRLRVQAACNATAPAINFTFGLYPVTVAGGANVIAVTLGTVVASSTVALNTPSASTVTTGAASDVTIPADGAYAIGVVFSGSQAANSYVALTAGLDVRHT